MDFNDYNQDQKEHEKLSDNQATVYRAPKNII